MNPQNKKRAIGSIIILLLIAIGSAFFMNKDKLLEQPDKVVEVVEEKISEVGEAFKKADKQLKKALGKKRVATTQPKFENVSNSAESPQTHVIIVGQFKTEYFFNENSKKLNDNGVKFQVAQVGNTRQIRIPIYATQNAKAELLKLKSTKIIPEDAYVRKVKDYKN